jgi:hypothetical protein
MSDCSDHDRTLGEAYIDGLLCASRGGDCSENPHYENTEQYIGWHSGFTNRQEWLTRHKPK